jgi:hypothetical protein
MVGTYTPQPIISAFYLTLSKPVITGLSVYTPLYVPIYAAIAATLALPISINLADFTAYEPSGRRVVFMKERRRIVYPEQRDIVFVAEHRNLNIA